MGRRGEEWGSLPGSLRDTVEATGKWGSVM